MACNSIPDLVHKIRELEDEVESLRDALEESENRQGSPLSDDEWDWIKKNKVDYVGKSFDKIVNYRHYNKEIGGYWLNSAAFFPELENGKFPTIDKGMEYVINPLNIQMMNFV